MASGTGGIFDPGGNRTVREAFIDLQQSERFREFPLRVRDAFQRVATWLPPRQASFPIVQVNASFAKMLRDKAGRERGYKFGNHTLLMLQSIIKASVDAGTLSSNRVKQVPKLLPPPLPPSALRRRIAPIRHPNSSATSVSRKENSSP